MASETTFFAPQAWISGGTGSRSCGAWAYDVLLHVAPDGNWQSITPGAPANVVGGATVLTGPVLPGTVNAHSHAFQRAIAGLTERSSAQQDNFWSWRDRMYHAALRITPLQLEAIATQLYGELLQGGYTQVCEFHYLHNHTDGRPYADPLELSMALIRAAQATGMGLTLLPTLYMRTGFGVARGKSALRDDQRRFASTPASVLHICDAVNALKLPRINAGVALHSLRAVDAAAVAEVAQATQQRGVPVHIHIAEQIQEVDDCITHHGKRPIEWLHEVLDRAAAPLGPLWNLVHATHTTAEELKALKAADASVVICPSTEANLGDGVFDFPGWAGVGGNWSIGSDSHVSRRASEELRLLEYSQRLSLRERNVAARFSGSGSSAEALFGGALRGASTAAGLSLSGIAVGNRADFCVLDQDAPALAGVPAAQVLDAFVFSSPDAQFASVFVGGKPVPPVGFQRQSAYSKAVQGLWKPEVP